METIHFFDDFLWFTAISSLFVLLNISSIVYSQTKDKVFLYYALYNVFLLTYSLTKNQIGFNQLFTNHSFADLRSLNYYIQIIYNAFLFYFSITFLDLRKTYPRYVKTVDYTMKGLIIIGGIGFILSVIFRDVSVYKTLFSFFYIPIQLVLSFYGMFLSLFVVDKSKYYYFSGLLFYISFALIAYIFTIQKITWIESLSPIAYYFIGVLFEGMIFSVGLGIRIKRIYDERLNYQKELVDTQIKLGKQLEEDLKIKEEINRLLSREVTGLELEKQVTNLKYLVMNSQMNSHFLFNVLNSIKSYIIENDTKNAVFYLNKFAKFIRMVLDVNRGSNHTLADEIKSIRMYLEIEQLRLQKSFHFQIINHLPENQMSVLFPHLLLQPFVENAIWHGLMNSDSGKMLEIRFEEWEGKVKIAIDDDGIGYNQSINKPKSVHKKHHSVGLNIINERIELHNKTEKHTISYEIKDKKAHEIGQGTLVVVLVDLPK